MPAMAAQTPFIAAAWGMVSASECPRLIIILKFMGVVSIILVTAYFCVKEYRKGVLILKIIVQKDGEKKVAVIQPYNGEKVWVEFDDRSEKKQLYSIGTVREMFKKRIASREMISLFSGTKELAK